jgi:hypothetical protein
MMRRRRWVFVLSIPLLIIAADLAYWVTASNHLRAGYQDWLAARAKEGWDVQSEPVSIGGWPRNAAVAVPSLTLRHAGADIPGDLRVVSAGLTLSVSLLHPSDLGIALTGPLRVQIGGSPEVMVTAGECLASVPMVETDPMPVGLEARDLRLEAANHAWQLDIGLLNAQAEVATDANMADSAQAAARFTLSSEAIGLPASIKWPLGPNISSLSLAGVVNGKLPATRDITQWATNWRDAGGSLEISHMVMGWGPLGVTSSATLALDDQLQPMGSGSGRLIGYAETLDRLAGAGVLTRSAATAAKAVLSLMAGTADGDTPSAVDVPLTLQYRTLSMRQVPLLRLPELDWPAH